MKTQINISLIGVDLPGNVTAELNNPRAPLPVPALAMPPGPKPISLISLELGQLTSEQVEWLIDDFASRLRSKAGVKSPPIARSERETEHVRLQYVVDDLCRMEKGQGHVNIVGMSGPEIVKLIRAQI
jgi:hypothetical protein